MAYIDLDVMNNIIIIPFSMKERYELIELVKKAGLDKLPDRLVAREIFLIGVNELRERIDTVEGLAKQEEDDEYDPSEKDAMWS